MLSAYLDGELTAAERQQAERLLESSDGARAYLRDLRAINSVEMGAFPTIPAGLAAGGAIAGGKLTASAIKSAAAKGQGIGSLTSGWGFAGLAAAAALVVAGYNFLGDSVDKPVETRVASAPVVAPATSQAPLPVLDVDSSSFVIPAMTPSELLDFAVEGTLPIDSERERFITVLPNGENALAVSMHGADVRRVDYAEDIPVTGLRRLDSVHQMVRTALVPYSRNSIAVRSDLPLLRLQVLEQLSESLPAMSAEVRQEIERARTELQAAHREVERTRTMLLSNHGGVAAGVQPRTVLYIPIESEEVRRFTSGEWQRMGVPTTFRIVLNESDVMAADQALLEAASSGSFPMLGALPQPAIRRTETRVAVGAGDPTSGAPTMSRRPRNIPAPPAVEPPQVNVNRPPTVPTEPNGRRSQEDLDRLLREAEQSLQNARESLRRADELNKQQSGTRSNTNDGAEGAGNGSDPDPEN